MDLMIRRKKKRLCTVERVVSCFVILEFSLNVAADLMRSVRSGSGRESSLASAAATPFDTAS